MKKLIFIFAGLLVTSLLSSCADYTDIPSASTSNTETIISDTTEDSVYLYEPSAAFYSFDGISSPVSAYGGNTSETGGTLLIERDRAIDVALNHVELKIEEVFDIEAELEYDYSGTFWEVEFQKDNLEYSFCIDAESGNVVRNHTEPND